MKAGAPVDATVAQLAEYMEPGDIIVDGGNEWCVRRVQPWLPLLLPDVGCTSAAGPPTGCCAAHAPSFRCPPPHPHTCSPHFAPLYTARYENTERRQALMKEKGIFHIGMGVSGGEEGARNGGYRRLRRLMGEALFCATGVRSAPLVASDVSIAPCRHACSPHVAPAASPPRPQAPP